MKDKIQKQIKEALKNLGIHEDVSFSVEHPTDFKNGDYSANVAMVCAKQQKINPKELAEKIVLELKGLPKQGFGGIEKIEVAGPGFINFYLSREFFTESVKEILNKGEEWGKNSLLSGKKVMVEYTDPNPFKPFHIGHLMANAIGESISRVVEFSGAKTIRANYQGDVGPHVAKAIWGIIHSGEKMEGKNALWIGECYSLGATLYESLHPKGIEAKKEIDEINKKIYDKSDPKINEIYDWGRKETLDAFEEIYKILGTKFEYYFFESEMAPIGEEIVRANAPKVFSESDGAIVFHGENYDKKLHTRVFINSQGLPTYETKEIGLALTKFEKENPDISITTTAIEQGEYMKVVQKAISLIHPDLESKMKHVTHGMMRFADGKMSSRKGNVITGESLLRDSMDIVKEKMKDSKISEEEKTRISEIVGVSALKYSILRSSLGSDIIYDSEKSISFEGDSGPYLQYTHARICTLLEKAKEADINTESYVVENPERELEQVLIGYRQTLEKSFKDLGPHHIVQYLLSLTRAFNAMYGRTQIVDVNNKEKSAYYVMLATATQKILAHGLHTLGIKAPERM